MRPPLWKQEKAEADLAPLLQRVRNIDAALLDEYPRNVRMILSVGLPSAAIRQVENLCGASVMAALAREHGIECAVLPDDQPLCGLTYASDRLVVIFVEKHQDDASLRFTLAHEAGHLATEYLPLLERGELEGLQLLMADPLTNFTSNGKKPPRREVVANSCAAALLAPMDEVRKLHAYARADDARAVQLVSERFGFSRLSAAIRLMELGLIPQVPLSEIR
jgi:hypothetical protein